MAVALAFMVAVGAVTLLCTPTLVASTCLQSGGGSGILATSVRDLNLGVWVGGIPVELYTAGPAPCSNCPNTWCLLATNVTNSAGKIPIVVQDAQFPVGRYRLVFYTYDYFNDRSLSTFYPYAEVQFDKLSSDQGLTMLVPMLVSQYSYTSYRGSLG